MDERGFKLGQESADHGPWAIFGLLSIFVSEVLLELIHARSLTYCLSCFCAATAELSNCE